MRRLLISVLIAVWILTLAYVTPVSRTWITSTFGELRSGMGPHFHMGIDFSTWEGSPKIGVKIRAVESGYLEKIIIDPDDLYGCMVVLVHNGYKTVYAHLSGFSGDLVTSTGGTIKTILEDLRREFGLDGQSWKVKLNELRRRLSMLYGGADPFMNEDDVFPLCFDEGWKGEPRRIVIKFPAGEVKVEEGEVIGFSGISGNVQGPHCHFEVRNLDETISYDPLTRYPDFLKMIEKPSDVKTVLEKIAIDGNVYEYSPEQVYEFSGDFPRISLLAYTQYKISDRVYKLGIKEIYLKYGDKLLYELVFDEISRKSFKNAYEVYDKELSKTVGKYEAWYSIKAGKADVVKVVNFFKIPDRATLDLIVVDYFGGTSDFKIKLRRRK